MGKILNIRVMAQTYSEDDVPKAWPRLTMLVWPEWSAKLGMNRVKDGLPGYSAGASPIEKKLGSRKHGVMELAEALPDLINFGDLPAPMAEALKEPAAQTEKLRRDLEKALADWDVKTASDLTYKLEDAMSKAERSLDKVK